MNAIIGSGFDSMGWVPEGQRSGQMSYSTSNKTSPFVTIGEEDAATFEAISAGRQFEDIQAQMAFRLLQKMMLKEEMAILAGNASLSLGTPATPTLSASGSGATLPAATYFVRVVGLTLEGYQNSSILGGVATSKTVTGADGKSFALSGGSSAISAEASQAVTLGQTLFCSVSPSQGAVAYAWYVSTPVEVRPCKRSRRSTALRFPPHSALARSRKVPLPQTIRPTRVTPTTDC